MFEYMTSWLCYRRESFVGAMMDAIDEYPLNNDEDVEVPNTSSKKSSRGSNYSVDEDHGKQ
jgi:hypothetical protein